MLHNTKAIVLRTVKYGDTSLIVSMLTEKFGLQDYLLQGVRSNNKSGMKAMLFQPAAILDCIVYHNDLKNLQRVKEARWSFIYEQIYSNIHKNAVALFMVELLTRCLKQPGIQEELFAFTEDALQHLDRASGTVTANFPLFYALHLASLAGFQLVEEYGSLGSTRESGKVSWSNSMVENKSEKNFNEKPGQALSSERVDPDKNERVYLDLQEGRFEKEKPAHMYYLEPPYSGYALTLVRTRRPEELEELHLNQQSRRTLMDAVVTFYRLHVAEFGTLRTLPVLQEVLG